MNNKEAKNAIIRAKAHEQKAQFIYAKGNKCECCGMDFRTLASANFHHKDSTTKEYNLAHMFGKYRLDKIQAEVNKCVLLCANCHNDLHEVFGETVTEEQTMAFINEWFASPYKLL